MPRRGIGVRRRALRPWFALLESISRRGIQAYRDGDYSTACRRMGLRVRLPPDDWLAWLYLARAQRELGRPERSLRTIYAALGRRPGWPPGVRHAVELELELERPEAARRALESVDPLDPLDAEELRLLRRIALPIYPGIAIRFSDELLRREPDSRDAAALRAEAVGRSGDRQEGLRLAAELAEQGDDAALAAAVGLLEHWDELERAVELATGIGGSDPDRSVEVARLLQGHGFAAEALALLERSADTRQVRQLRSRIGAQLRVLRGWRPTVAAVATSPTPGRVLHLAHASLPHQVSGYTVRTHRIATAQRAIGIDAQVLTRIGFPGIEGVDPVETVDGVPYHRLNSPGANLMPSDERLQAHADLAADAAVRLGISVLHPASDYPNALVALSIRAATGIPVVYEVRGFWEETWLARQPSFAANSASYTLRREVNRRCMLEADHVVTLGETMKRLIVDRGVEPDKVSVVPNAIDPDQVYPAERPADLAAELGIDREDVVVGYVGSLLAYEGLDQLIRAVAGLAERGTAIRCLIVGDGPEREPLVALADRLGVADRVSLPGAVPPADVPRYYALLDVFAMPRRDLRVCSMVTPLKPYEAMAAGVPLLLSDVAALAEVVEDGRTGLLVRAGDAASLEQALERLVFDPGVRTALADRALSWVRAERTWEQNALAYRGIYERLAPS